MLYQSIQRVVKQFPVSLVLLLLFLQPLYLSAAGNETSLPTTSALTESLKHIEKKKLEESEEQALRDIIEKTIDDLNNIEKSKKKYKQLRAEYKAIPAKLKKVEAEVAKINIPEDNALLQKFKKMDSRALDETISDKQGQLAEFQSQLDRTKSLITITQKLPESTKEDIRKNNDHIEELNAVIRDIESGDDSDSFPEERAQQSLAQIEFIQQKNKILRLQNRNSSKSLKLLQAQEARLNAQIKVLDKEVKAMETLVIEKRTEEAKKVLDSATKVTESITKKHPSVQKEAKKNLDHSNALSKVAEKIGEYSKKVSEIKQAHETIKKIQQDIDQQTALLGGSHNLGKFLRKQKQILPKTEFVQDLPEVITNLRFNQFQLEEEKKLLEDDYIKKITKKLPADLPEQERALIDDEINKLVNTRKELLDSLINQHDKLLKEAIDLAGDQKSLEKNRDELAVKLQKQLFWIASNDQMDIDWFKNFSGNLSNQVKALKGSPWESLIINVQVHWPEALMFLVLILFCIFRRQSLADYQQWQTEKVGKVQRDNLSVTPKVLAVSLMHSLPVPLALFALGYFINGSDNSTLSKTLSDGFIAAAIASLCVIWLKEITKSEGITTEHFKWKPEVSEHVHRNVRKLALGLIPLAFITAASSYLMVELDSDVIGQIPFMVASLLLSMALVRLIQPPVALFKSVLLHYLFGYFFALTPLAMVVLTLMGYFYTALTVQGLLLASLYVLLGWVIIHALIIRNLHVAARRLAFQRALEKRAASRDAEQTQEVFEEPTIDIEAISSQSTRLINAAMLAVLVGVFYLIWSSLLPVFEYLNTFTLWEYKSTTETGTELVPIKLKDFLLSLVIFGVSMILSRNLPGLLEIAILSKLRLRQGTAYALTTMVRYVISGVGIIMALSTLGLEWSKLQWLVAALGVGLGFGLQEIFANFISGLIILFERPVRIGDTVTIGDQHGVVSLIRIRATTITDWDNKEIIIPNKVFVTDQLINWSLSNPITRVIINVGVAYGSDLDLTRKLLLKAAHEHPKVLHDPAPDVFFLAFGDSTLNHELRIHVQELRDRLPVIDQLNRTINQLFAKHNIEIAFPQQDIHIKEWPQQMLPSPEDEG
ncbi:mechanosensitive channel MscK [Endozoicomonas sp. SM1973]|uniref:Mechanosensitive channel MscK n=1 Tax=Spartinivicinus marinus TaxID=2994442 RepID=A0A853IBM0_9GAMM|nr:mechanosensitive channel MscK [Spartinivicinus marinus]MCX4026394.1 mechanosensitive channel MscK [Spartinivicinus marinus]NYZ67261.1 mechanosensitive channel MscK [Spartinivicinus marinus]